MKMKAKLVSIIIKLITESVTIKLVAKYVFEFDSKLVSKIND